MTDAVTEQNLRRDLRAVCFRVGEIHNRAVDPIGELIWVRGIYFLILFPAALFRLRIFGSFGI